MVKKYQEASEEAVKELNGKVLGYMARDGSEEATDHVEKWELLKGF